MTLFKFFRKKESKPTKSDLEAFKVRLKLGDDPKEHWDAQEEHWDKYRQHKATALELLRKLYDVQDVSKIGYYEELTVWPYRSSGPCNKSPLGKHIYINHMGEKNPKKEAKPVCLACDTELGF